tara:strand:+ start:2468 stop:2683 length:216 start_codon:yes stop_codon:yes gene_type:complete
MIYPQIEGSDNQAKLIGLYDNNELVKGQFTDEQGNIFNSKKPDVSKIKSIEDFIKNHFGIKNKKMKKLEMN